MEERSLRLLIRQKLRDGTLPYDHIPRVWGGPGSLEKCDACEATIGEHQILMEGLALEGGRLTIDVSDDGIAFNPLDATPPNLDLPIMERPVGGLGIHIVRTVMDHVEYQRRDGHNVLTMRKTIGRP